MCSIRGWFSYTWKTKAKKKKKWIVEVYIQVNKRGEIRRGRFACGGDCGNPSAIASGTITHW